MGGRGSFDHKTSYIPIDNREYRQIGSFGDIEIIEGIYTTNGKTPVLSNSPNSIYAVWSQKAHRIKHVFYYKDHILRKQIDIEGPKSHWHNIAINPQTGEIGRISHDPSNVHEPTNEMWNIINNLSKWKKTE